MIEVPAERDVLLGKNLGAQADEEIRAAFVSHEKVRTNTDLAQPVRRICGTRHEERNRQHCKRRERPLHTTTRGSYDV